MADVPFHDAAAVFPMMLEDDFDGLVEDIREHGLLEPIELFDGRVLDGRNRYRACLLAGVEPRYIEVHPDDPVAYVVSKNLHRRHLKESQRAMVAAAAKEVYAKLAKERQRESTSRAGVASGIARRGGVNVVENLPPRSDAGKARDQAAALVGVSGRSVDHASKVLKHGDPEVVNAVKAGQVPVSVAARLVDVAKPEQRAAIAGGKEAIKRTVAELPAAPPKPKLLPVSKQAWDRLKECSDRLNSIIEQAGGSLDAMFAHPRWDKRDTYYVVEMIEELHKMFSKLNREARKHADDEAS